MDTTTKRKGFTLIELLVVISIIAILMAILMPAMSRVKKQAKKIACMSNLRQWGLRWSMYLSDSNGRLPGLMATGYSGKGVWYDHMRETWNRQPKVRVCPVASKPVQDENGHATGAKHPFAAWGKMTGNAWTVKGDYGSYGVNMWVFKVNPKANLGWKRHGYYWQSTYVKRTSYIPFVLDSMWMDAHPVPFSNPPEYDGEMGSPEEGIKRFCMNRHVGTVNGLFLDMSVRNIGLKGLWTLRWHQEFDISGSWTRAGGVQSEDWPDWMKAFTDKVL